MSDIAQNDINYYAKNINTYAGISINETGKQGVFFGTPEPAPPIENLQQDTAQDTADNTPSASDQATTPQNESGTTSTTSVDDEKPKKCIIEFSVKNKVINDGTFGFDTIPSNYNTICESNIQDLENEYNPFEVESEQYFPPWVSIRVGQTIILQLNKTFNKKDEYQSVAFEEHNDFSYRYMKGSTEVTDMIEAKEVHITCSANNESPDGTLIKVKADGADAGGINIWYPTPKTIDLQWHFVEITGNDKDRSALEDKLKIRHLLSLLEKGLKPSLIDINVTNNVATIVDITAENERLKRERVIKKSDNHHYIEREMKQDFVATIRQNHNAPNNIVTLYLVNRSCLITGAMGEEGGRYQVVAGFSPTGTGIAYGILDGEQKLRHTAIMHEVMHALGLRHTFSRQAVHTFADKKTKNYMDYHETKKYTWKWQWAKLHTYQHLQ